MRSDVQVTYLKRCHADAEVALIETGYREIGSDVLRTRFDAGKEPGREQKWKTATDAHCDRHVLSVRSTIESARVRPEGGRAGVR